MDAWSDLRGVGSLEMFSRVLACSRRFDVQMMMMIGDRGKCVDSEVEGLLIGKPYVEARTELPVLAMGVLQ